MAVSPMGPATSLWSRSKSQLRDNFCLSLDTEKTACVKSPLSGQTSAERCGRFVNNTCGSGGGGILTFSYDGIVIDSCSFQDNTALAGAAAYIVRSQVLHDTPLRARLDACN